MICYTIKNDKSEYFKVEPYRFGFFGTLDDCTLYSTKEECERKINLLCGDNPPKYKIAKIKIKEV